MVTLEQIRLLESKIIKAIDALNYLNSENLRLKKRNAELEELAERLKNEKDRVEEGIVSALDRLNQFEDALERSLSAKPPEQTQYASVPAARPLPPVPEPVREQPPDVQSRPAPDGVPSAYMIDEEDAGEPENGEQGEAELDIF